MRAFRKRIATSDGLTNADIEKERRKNNKRLKKMSKSISNIARCCSIDLQQLWPNCVKYNVPFDISPETSTVKDNTAVVKRLTTAINIAKDEELKGITTFLPFDYVAFNDLSWDAQKEFAVCRNHESHMFQLSHKMCKKCRSVSLVKEFIQCRDGSGYVCSDCQRTEDSYYFQRGCNRLLPVWYDDRNVARFDVPPELKELRLGEKLLIQRFSCFVPLVHIRNGVMGLKGHCCCFKQDVSEIASVLPHRKVNAILVVKDVKDKHGKDLTVSFIVRRSVVLNALKWLKRYHKWYREDPDLIIDENNLDWMNGAEECLVPGVHVVEEGCSKQFSHGFVSDGNDIENYGESVGK